MLFSNFHFTFVFLPLVLTGYYLLLSFKQPVQARIWLLAASIFFYCFWSLKALPILAGSILFNYFVGTSLTRQTDADRKGRLLAFGVAANIGLLGIFKYAGFLSAQVNALFGTALPIVSLDLPLGISFFTFHQIAYLVWASQSGLSNKSLTDYALFISFFPQLIAGPIVLYKEMVPQFTDPENQRFDAEKLARGIFMFGIGLFKKLVIANNLAPMVAIAFDRENDPGFWRSFCATFGYTFQLYFDFSGYIDMAIGLGLMFNFRLPPNFNSPFKALNITDFWARWHMTLTRFITNYLYAPMALRATRYAVTRRLSKQATFWLAVALPTLVTFALAGLWHGAGWTFVLFGVLHGLALVAHKAWQRLKRPAPKPLAWLVTFSFVVFAFIVFRAVDMAAAMKVFRSLGGHYGVGWYPGETDRNLALILLAAGIAFVPKNSLKWETEFQPDFRHAVATVLIICFSLAFTAIQADFLYWQF